ncbi:MAG: helix-turn-helix domain-containing protein [Cytophagaceae bacterium]|nr:helix-turn-helix domain-containing protein [Cytophagaceae bacterium]
MKLADALDTSREVVSRLLKILEKQGAIRIPRNQLKLFRLV